MSHSFGGYGCRGGTVRTGAFYARIYNLGHSTLTRCFRVRFFLPSGEKWKTLAAGEAPASFTEVSYELADSVVVLDSTVSDKIASAGQLLAGGDMQDKSAERIIREGGYIGQDVLDSALSQKGREAEPGMIVIDPQAGTSFKIGASTAFANGYGDAGLDQQAKAFENTYMLEQPQVNKVFKDFSLGGADGETASLTRGNITGFAEGVEGCVVEGAAVEPMAFGDALKDYKHLKGDKLINLEFTNTELHTTSGGKELTVRLSGGLGISTIGVDARYSAFGGYHLIMDVAEEFYLVVKVQGTIQEEIRIPLFGIDIPFGIGSVRGGLYLIVGIDGDIRIEAEAREYASARMGVRGKTALGVLGHGELPGAATFAITTDIAEGTQVNVYKYDVADGFTLVAGNIAVGAGSVVTYKNNTMSEYLITTATIGGAQVSDMAGLQSFAPDAPWLPVAILGLAAAGIAAAVWIFLNRRNRANRTQ